MTSERDERHVTRHRAEPDEPVLPERSSDDTDAAWGDGPPDRDAEWYRAQKPPHHE